MVFDYEREPRRPQVRNEWDVMISMVALSLAGVVIGFALAHCGG